MPQGISIKDIDIITVRLNSDIVGKIALSPEGLAVFEYDKNWLSTFNHNITTKQPNE